MTFLAKPSMAIGFGAFFLCAVTCTHLDEFATPLSLVPDLGAGLTLLVGGTLSHRDWGWGRQFQIAAWAFMASLLFASFFGNLSDWLTAAPDATGTSGLVSFSEGTYVALIGVLLTLALAGLVGTLISKDVSSRRHGHVNEHDYLS
jgi:hypothetical protein